MPPAIASFDPDALARRQLERDRRRTAAFPGLFAHKLERMRASPLAYLRGAAPLYYDLLKANRDLSRGPGGEGIVAGDLHVENFGAYRPHAHAADEDEPKKGRGAVVTFHLNDFDDAAVAPWRFDVLRLATSLVLGARAMSAGGARANELVDALLDAYVARAFARRPMPPAPPPVEQLVGRVLVRTRRELLDARTEIVRGERRFLRGERYRPIARALQAEARRAFARYVDALGDDAPSREHFEVLDLAFRVAGTGSLGGLRVAVLARGKGGHDGAWVFDMKEQGVPSAAALVGVPRERPAERVLEAMRACLASPPRMLGTTTLGTRSMLVRRLSPQEDKLDWTKLRDADLEPLARFLGALAGDAHRRGAAAVPKRAWSEEERARVAAQALVLAAAHEGAYLAMCRITA